MKKLIASLLLVVLVVPGLAWAEEAKETKHPRKQKVTHSHVPMAIEGKIVSLSANTVTIATGAKSQDDKAKVKRVKVWISDTPGVRVLLANKGFDPKAQRLLLAKGLGRKTQLLCQKTHKGDWMLQSIKSIEGVEVPKRRASFRILSEHIGKRPELRKELRELAKKDPEAFRRRIRQIHASDGTKLTFHLRDGRGLRWSGPGGGRGGLRGGRGMVRPGSPQIAKLEQQSQELAKQYRQAKGRDKEELGEKLRKTLTEVFELKVQTQAKQVQRLERQLEKLRDQLEKRERNREAMIQKRFTQLTGQKEDLPW